MRDFTKIYEENQSCIGYGGRGKKRGVFLNDKPYFLKKCEQSLGNSPVCEYLASKIFSLFLPTQEVILGFLDAPAGRESIVACKDFRKKGEYFYEFFKVKNSILDGSGGRDTDLASILHAIDKQHFIDANELKKRFWDTFILDAYLGNFDRHNDNWGILVDEGTKKVRLAPVYSCASCLYPEAFEAKMQSLLEDENELKSFCALPTSAIKENGKKINYHDFLNDLKDKNALKSLKDLVPKIEAKNLEIENIINDLKISDIRKSFYKIILKVRFEMILKPAFERIKA